MQKRKRINTIGTVLISSTILFAASSGTANAWFFDTFENIVEMSLNTIQNIVLGLSDDIGEMSDDIGTMADRIGEMADRIVHTEELMMSAVSNNSVSSLITWPTEGATAYRTMPIDITLSSQKTTYILYMSNNADMSGATNALVQNGNTYNAWNRVADFATSDKLYIAVKTVDANSSSDFSNTVMLNLQ
jgi:hypothetical protein